MLRCMSMFKQIGQTSKWRIFLRNSRNLTFVSLLWTTSGGNHLKTGSFALASFLSDSTNNNNNLKNSNNFNFLGDPTDKQRSDYSTTTTTTACTMQSSSNENHFSGLWQDKRKEALAKCVLPMSETSHKGSSGRVAILGGSARYTGAPYYAAMASLQVGADLAYVFCAQEAAMAIKCYSPELMVAPVYNAAEFDEEVASNPDSKEAEQLVDEMVEAVTSSMANLHVLVVGPGLGRCPLVLRATAKVLEEAMNLELGIVMDADALFMLTLEPYKHLIAGYPKIILTPNVMEYKRLIQANGGSEEEFIQKSAKDATVVKKGRHDIITTTAPIMDSEVNPTPTTAMRQMVCKEEGGLKRSGGIGDILAGTLGTFLAWDQILEQRDEQHDMMLASWSACCLVKQATKKAFDSKRRAMTAPDVLEKIGETMQEMETGENL